MKRENFGRPRAKAPIGKRFGKWTVVGEGDNDPRGNTRWICRCECGYERIALPHTIKREKNAIPCKGMHGGRSSNFNSAARDVFYRYQSGARTRGYTFSLSVEEFEAITQEPCFYCGIPPFRSRTLPDSAFTYNGIDRKDNAQGYYPDNCVPCCWQCNKLKGSMDFDEFMKWIERVIGYRGQPKENTLTQVLLDIRDDLRELKSR